MANDVTLCLSASHDVEEKKKGSKPKITVTIGSTRTSRCADKPAAWLMEWFVDRGDMAFELVDMHDFDLPLFDAAASNLWARSCDPRAVACQQTVSVFGGSIFLTVKYNPAITSALKDALDQADTEEERKPMAAFGYGGVGAAHAIEYLRTIAVEAGSHAGGCASERVSHHSDLPLRANPIRPRP